MITLTKIQGRQGQGEETRLRVRTYTCCPVRNKIWAQVKTADRGFRVDRRTRGAKMIYQQPHLRVYTVINSSRKSKFRKKNWHWSRLGKKNYLKSVVIKHGKKINGLMCARGSRNVASYIGLICIYVAEVFKFWPNDVRGQGRTSIIKLFRNTSTLSQRSIRT